ncbi:MAG: DUF2096 family protein [Candidatus Bathyarchaeota archaeon]|nr:DUF2096 family protein [Candidatus Bathyarchaeota archaeon]MDH5788684.1 DUF2096 family protein [Candidatus Bathyarchaeota archaeon]
MRYSAVWKTLEEMIADFRRRGITIPAEVMNNLKSAKTMITILKADTSRGETIQKIEEHLGSVESYLISEGQKKLGTEYVDKWLKRLDEASRKPFDEEKEERRFVPGIPREHKWIRVKPSTELPPEKLKALAKKSKLSCKVQNDGYLLVYGEDERIKEFVRKMATKYEAETRK